MTSTSKDVKPRSVRTRTAIHLGIAVFLIAVGFAFIAPSRLDISVLLKQVMKGIGVTSLGTAGFISTATLLGDGVTETLWGRVSDRWSRSLALTVGMAVMSIFTLLTTLGTSLPTMFTVRILLGVGQAMFIPAYLAFVGSLYGRYRGLLCGSLGGFFTIGSAINPVLTADLYHSNHKWQTPFIYYGIFGLILAVLIFLVSRGRRPVYDTVLQKLPETPSPAAGKRDTLATRMLSKNMILLMTTMIFWGLTQYGYTGIFADYLEKHQHFSLGTAAAVLSIASWTSFGFSFIGGYLSDHIGRRRSLLIFGTIGLLAAIPLFTVTSTYLAAVFVAAIFQAMNGTFYPLGVAYSQDLAKSEHIGVHTGSVSGIGHIMAGVSGLIAGNIAGSFGYANLSWVMIGGSAIMIGCIFFTRDLHNAASRQPAEVAPASAPT